MLDAPTGDPADQPVPPAAEVPAQPANNPGPEPTANAAAQPETVPGPEPTAEVTAQPQVGPGPGPTAAEPENSSGPEPTAEVAAQPQGGPSSEPTTYLATPPETGSSPELAAGAPIPPAAPASNVQNPYAGAGPNPYAFPAPSPWAAPGAPTSGYPAPAAGWPGPVPPGWAHPGLSAPKPKVSRAAVIVSVVAAVIVLACLGFGTISFFALRNADSDQASSEPRNVPPTDFPTLEPTDEPTDEPTPDEGPTHDGDLPQYVVKRPSGAHAIPKVKADEALNLTGAAASFANPAEGKLILQRYAFMDGYTRRWIDKDGNFVVVRLLRFMDTGNADNFTNFYIDANQAGGWGEPKDVPDVPTAAGFVKAKPEKNGFQRSLAVGEAGDIVAIVVADQLPPAKASVPDKELAAEFQLL